MSFETVSEFVKNNKDLQIELLKKIVLIPAPSHNEKERAEFCKSYLESIGAKGTYIDEACNVIFPLNCENSNSITVIAAHTDTVFPIDTPLEYTDDGTNIHCPGIADDVASVVAVLLTAKYFLENNIVPKNGILFVLNSCEEGLGNLKGVKTLFENYRGRIEKFVSFDASLSAVHNSCVGSHRYNVTVKTAGGHSYGAFGNANAIHKLSQIINKIYSINIPQIGKRKTTYNVGTVSGGTSVNSIAQSASMLCEYRSDDVECLAIMQKEFENIFKDACDSSCEITVEKIGDRPCAKDVDKQKIDDMFNKYAEIAESITGVPVVGEPASTDCNVPLSLGIPAIAVGAANGKNEHTTEEYLEKDSLVSGLNIAIQFVLKITL